MGKKILAKSAGNNEDGSYCSTNDHPVYREIDLDDWEPVIGAKIAQPDGNWPKNAHPDTHEQVIGADGVVYKKK